MVALPFTAFLIFAFFVSGHVLRILEAMKLWCRGRGTVFLLIFLIFFFTANFMKPVTSQVVNTYHPSEYSLLGRTAFISGALTDLQLDDSYYMTFRSYASKVSEQTLYAHQETTTIAGNSYYLQKLESADTTGKNLSASMDSTGRKLLGRFVYQLTGVTSISASTWTVYYRAWHSDVPVNILENSPSSVPLGVWIDPTYAYSSDNAYAYTSIDSAIQVYGNYGFNVPSTASITKVEVGCEAYTETDEQIGITCSWDNGTNWAIERVLTLETNDPDAVTWVDFTDATDWTPEKLSDENFLTKVRGIRVGGGSMDDVYLDWIPVRITYVINPSAHLDVDVLIRKADGEARQTIASDVANSGTLSTTAQTLSGTYSWTEYTVVEETDYLEIDYFLDVTTANSGVTAYLLIDDGGLDLADQTRVAGVLLPSEYTMEVEFSGSSNTDYWSQLVWTVDSAWTTGSVSVVMQLYNYTLGAYPTSGEGYIEYTSSATSSTDETKSQIITTNPLDFRDASGNWKIKIKGVKSTTSQFDFKVDLVRFETTTIVPPDIRVSNITLSSTNIYSGETVTINVTVKNEGGTTETFNVTIYANNTEIQKQTVSNLIPDTSETLSFVWNTTEIQSGSYVIKAVADILPDEEDTADNTYVNGHVTISDIRDVAIIDVRISPENVIVGQNVNITVIVKNEGSVSENFNVTTFYNSTVIKTETVTNLDPDAERTLYIIWNTTGVSAGNYTIKAEVSGVPDEIDTTDNIFVDGILDVSMIYIHDVAVVSVTPSVDEAYIGQIIKISVVVKNEGTVAETFNVTAYFNETVIETRKVSDLAPSEERSLVFYWNTTGLAENSRYIIKVVVSEVQGETDVLDNFLKSGIVTLKSSTQPSLPLFPLNFTYAIPIGLFSILFLSLGLIWRRRGGKPKSVGFEFFDEITNGGIPESSSVMITGGPSSGKSILCQQLAFNHLEKGKSCIYISYDCFPDEVRRSMKNFLWDVSAYEKKERFCFIDCYSQIAGVETRESYSVDQPFSLSDLSIVISEAMGSIGQESAMVILDSATALFARIDSGKVLEFMQDRSARIKGEKGIFIFIVGKGTVSADQMNKLEEMVDCIIELQATEERGKIARRLRVRKLRGRDFIDEWVPFRIESKKGITFLIKKRK